MSYPKISVIIPVKNEVYKIRACIDGILSQTIPVTEIIVIDSGSTDGTLDILKEYAVVKVIEIPSSSFNHGTTRNLGIDHATGEFVLFTVGDARAADNTWIEELLKGFTDDEVAGVCGQQIVPHDTDKNPVEWFRPVSSPEMKRYQFKEPGSFEALSAEEKKRICGWDDVTALYRLSVMKQIPFQKITYGEDPIWAKDALLNGYAIVYNHHARVYHYHLEDAAVTFKKSLTTMYFRYRQFGYLPAEPVMSFRSKLSIIKILFTSFGLRIQQIAKWYRYNISNFKAGRSAYLLFMQALQKNDAELDALHAAHCGQPPVPLKVK